VALLLAGCGSGTSRLDFSGPLPGTARPAVTIGDKNFTEQFILGQLYEQALVAEGFKVSLTPNIGPTPVSFEALTSGRLDMYPEYVDVWNTFVAGYGARRFPSYHRAYLAAERFAAAHGLRLLRGTRFSDTNGIAVTRAYGIAHRLTTLRGLRRIASALALGAPAQFQYSSVGLSAMERDYGFLPGVVKTLNTGDQYAALAAGSVQAAYTASTDGELAGRRFRMLQDPRHAAGFGNAIPIVPVKVLEAEGPAFSRTIDRVSRLLTTAVIRRLNGAVDLGGQTPPVVAHAFLLVHGLVPRSSPAPGS
jgi:osmoprotectant transport system substrate-binding protein